MWFLKYKLNVQVRVRENWMIKIGRVLHGCPTENIYKRVKDRQSYIEKKIAVFVFPEKWCENNPETC